MPLKHTLFEHQKLEYEEWKTIPFYPRYEVSNLGVVRRRETKQAIGSLSAEGYMKVKLYHFTQRSKSILAHKTFSVARLVLTAFVESGGNFQGKQTLVAWYRNGRRFDCRLRNLEWVTKKEANERIWKLGNRRQNPTCLKHLKNFRGGQ